VIRVWSILTLSEVTHIAPTDEVSYFKAFLLRAKQQCQHKTFGHPWLPKFSGGVNPTSQHLIFENFFCVPRGILRSKLGIAVFHHHLIIHVIRDTFRNSVLFMTSTSPDTKFITVVTIISSQYNVRNV
jgi:hypothetical protein